MCSILVGKYCVPQECSHPQVAARDTGDDNQAPAGMGPLATANCAIRAPLRASTPFPPATVTRRRRKPPWSYLAPPPRGPYLWNARPFSSSSGCSSRSTGGGDASARTVDDAWPPEKRGTGKRARSRSGRAQRVRERGAG